MTEEGMTSVLEHRRKEKGREEGKTLEKEEKELNMGNRGQRVGEINSENRGKKDLCVKPRRRGERKSCPLTPVRRRGGNKKRRREGKKKKGGGKEGRKSAPSCCERGGEGKENTESLFHREKRETAPGEWEKVQGELKRRKRKGEKKNIVPQPGIKRKLKKKVSFRRKGGGKGKGPISKAKKERKKNIFTNKRTKRREIKVRRKKGGDVFHISFRKKEGRKGISSLQCKKCTKWFHAPITSGQE